MAEKILVTGACGLIGRALHSFLKRQGNDVIGVDNYTRFPDYESEVIKSDVRSFLENNTTRFDTVYHLAAINGTTNFYRRPLDVIKNNNETDLAVFEYVRNAPGCKLMYASSSEVVAGTKTFPTKEEKDIHICDTTNPRWSYRLNKIISENYLMNSKINFVILRFFNLFSEHSGEGHFFYDICKKIKQNDFSIIGADETRSFCYVDDAIDAIIQLTKIAGHEIINVGSDEEISILDAGNIICEKMGIQPNWKFQKSKPGSVSRRCPDLGKLRSYIPKYSPREFKEVIKWLDI